MRSAGSPSDSAIHSIGPSHSPIAARNATAPSAQRPAPRGAGARHPFQSRQRIHAYGSSASRARKPTPLVITPSPAENTPAHNQPPYDHSNQLQHRPPTPRGTQNPTHQSPPPPL